MLIDTSLARAAFVMDAPARRVEARPSVLARYSSLCALGALPNAGSRVRGCPHGGPARFAWRHQGSLSAGVKVEGRVLVRAEGKEPDFTKTLSWLQQEIADDRILASALGLQRRFPSTAIGVASFDTNMLTKADAASIPTVDVDDE